MPNDHRIRRTAAPVRAADVGAMTTEQEVRAAKGPPDALLAIAKALDRIEAQLAQQPATEDGWGQVWTAPVAEPAFTIERDDEDGTMVTIKLPTPEKQDKRQEFAASTLQLEDNFPGVGAVEAYAVGGPIWLYEFDYQYVKNLPTGIKQMMVADLLEDDPQAAVEMGRDLLKSTVAEGPPSTGGEWV